MATIERTEKLHGSVQVPPSKSYTHRAVIAASLSEGISEISNPLSADDTLATVEACRSLGVSITTADGKLTVAGTSNLKAPVEPINCRLSASTLRFVTAVASLAKGKTILTGYTGLLKRPIGPLVDSLNQLGVICESNNGYPPVTVHGGQILGGRASIVGNVSSQFVTALLFACPLAMKESTIKLLTPLESRPYVQLTLTILEKHQISVQVLKSHEGYFISSRQKYLPFNHTVPGDFSSAAFLMAAAAVTNSKIRFEGLKVESAFTQPDGEILSILGRMGMKISGFDGGLEVFPSSLRGVKVDASDMPDLVPILAVLGCYAQNKTVIRNVERLRIKESDRVKTIVSELSKMGAKIHEQKNQITVEGPCQLKGAEINPQGDHRIAMACAVAALSATGKTAILDADCISKSYPNFLIELKKLGGKAKFA